MLPRKLIHGELVQLKCTKLKNTRIPIVRTRNANALQLSTGSHAVSCQQNVTYRITTAAGSCLRASKPLATLNCWFVHE